MVTLGELMELNAENSSEHDWGSYSHSLSTFQTSINEKGLQGGKIKCWNCTQLPAINVLYICG